MKVLQYSSIEDVKEDTIPDQTGQESPSLADLSSDSTPSDMFKNRQKQLKQDVDKKKRKQKRRKISVSSSEAVHDTFDSAFPARTPEVIRPISELLEEEITLPGESR